MSSPKALSRDAKLRGTVMNYAARWALKTSPFGTFVGIAAGRAGGEHSLGRVSLESARAELIPDLARLSAWLRPTELALRKARKSLLALNPLLSSYGRSLRADDRR